MNAREGGPRDREVVKIFDADVKSAVNGQMSVAAGLGAYALFGDGSHAIISTRFRARIVRGCGSHITFSGFDPCGVVADDISVGQPAESIDFSENLITLHSLQTHFLNWKGVM